MWNNRVCSEHVYKRSGRDQTCAEDVGVEVLGSPTAHSLWCWRSGTGFGTQQLC